MKNSIYIATTIDGYIASSDGGLDWLMNIPNPDNSDYGFNNFMSTVDAIVMGKNTFEKVLSFGEWPYSKRVFVLSNTLKKIPEHLSNKSEIVHGTIPDILSNLNNRSFSNLYIDGGKTIQSFLKLDLIDEMIITRVSVLLGEGIPLFSSLDKFANFKVLKTEKLNNSLVKIHYIRDQK